MLGHSETAADCGVVLGDENGCYSVGGVSVFDHLSEVDAFVGGFEGFQEGGFGVEAVLFEVHHLFFFDRIYISAQPQLHLGPI